MRDFKVTPWEVEGIVDYDRLIKMFGVKRIDNDVLELMKKVFGEVPFYVRRGIFYSHRDLNVVLEDYLENKPFYLYTGRGPSGLMHLGHVIPILFTKYIQEKVNTILLLQLTPDEKYMYHEEMHRDEIKKYTLDNIKDILALKFDEKKTYLIDDIRHIKYLYQIAISVARKITYSTVRAVFGFTSETNIGMIFYMAIQAAPAFLGYYINKNYVHCLIPAAIDQDPFWRVTRDIASKIGFPKPSQIHGKFLPSLKASGKMSTSQPETALYLSDNEKDVNRKIFNAFTGGQPTAALQKKLGGNPDICTIFSYYNFMFETDDDKLQERYDNCRSGRLLCGDCKQELIERVVRFLARHQEEKSKISNSDIEAYMLDNKLKLEEILNAYEMLR